MSSYVNAPATRLLATHCCMCSLPLVDADSVEAGIGPICRRKTKPETAPDWDAVTTALGAWAACDADEGRIEIFEAAMDLMQEAETTGEDRKLSNVITRYLAATGGRIEVGRAHVLAAIRAMGRARLADALARRMYGVRITRDVENPALAHVKCPYDDGFRSAMWGGGARVGTWDKKLKVYVVHSSQREALMQALARAYGGQALGPDGEEIDLDAIATRRAA